MSSDYSKGYGRDKQQVKRDNQYEMISNWFGDKSVRAWKKCLFILYQYGDMGTGEISRRLGVNQSTAYRVLKKQALDSKTKGRMQKNKIIWNLTDHGRNSVYQMYQKGFLPNFLFE